MKLKQNVAIFIGVGVALVFVGSVGTLFSSFEIPGTVTSAQDEKNATYSIEGESVNLIDGIAMHDSAPGAASKTITRYFGNALLTDLDGDGAEDDVAFIVTQDNGGSGTFYYAVAAVKTDEGFVGSDGYFLGDRVAPQSTNLSPNPRHKHVVVFNYADRPKDAAMSEHPSEGKSVYLKLVPETMRWAIVEPDFPGEAR